MDVRIVGQNVCLINKFYRFSNRQLMQDNNANPIYSEIGKINYSQFSNRYTKFYIYFRAHL